MSQNFQCKESGCTRSVNYVADNLIAFKKVTAIVKPKSRKSNTKTVYLTCGKGHTHPYTVKS